jgi:hypothetical protein
MFAACYVMSVRDRSKTPPEAYFRSAQRNLTESEDKFEPWILRETRKIVAKRLE